MTPRVERAASRVRAAALLLIVGLLAGPASTHFYWLLGGTWGLYDRSGARETTLSTGTRVLAAIVLVLLAGAVAVVVARVGWWRQTLVSERVVRFFASGLAAVFMLEALASFTWSREHEWWMYGPVSLLIAILALVVAGSEVAGPRLHRRHRTLPSR